MLITLLHGNVNQNVPKQENTWPKAIGAHLLASSKIARLYYAAYVRKAYFLQVMCNFRLNTVILRY